MIDYRIISQGLRVDESEIKKDFDEALAPSRKAMMDYMDKQIHDQIVGEVVAKSVAHESLDLTIERLSEAVDKIKRYDHIYIMESNHIPDNAIGVLWVRPEDARRFRK